MEAVCASGAVAARANRQFDIPFVTSNRPTHYSITNSPLPQSEIVRIVPLQHASWQATRVVDRGAPPLTLYTMWAASHQSSPENVPDAKCPASHNGLDPGFISAVDMAAGARPDSRKKISRRFTLPGPQPPMPAKTSGLDIITIKVLRVRLNADTFDSSMKGKACHPAATPLPTVWVVEPPARVGVRRRRRFIGASRGARRNHRGNVERRIEVGECIAQACH